MVQFFNQGNPQGKLAEVLGMSLGQGLGTGLNTYFANKALEGVIGDKALQKAPISERLGSLQSALSPYGEVGQNLLAQRMQIEQQDYQQNFAKQQTQENLEKETRLFAQQKELQELKNKGRVPLGGLTGQPIPEEIIQKIGEVLGKSKELNADELKLAFDKVVPSPYSNQYVENRRNQELLKTKSDIADKKIAKEHDIKFHQESEKYDELIDKEAKVARKQLDSIRDIKEGVKSGEIKPSSLANIFKGFGKVGEKISNALLNPKEATLAAAIPEFLEGRKELFGVRLSDADLKVLQDKLPDMGKSPAANLAILDIMEKYANASILKEEIAREVLEEKGIPTRSGKLRPLNYRKLVENRFNKRTDEIENGIRMITPDGREIHVPWKDKDRAIRLRAKRLNE